MRIRYIIDTHLHADYVSAGRAFAEAAGAAYVLFAEEKRHHTAFRSPGKSEFVRARLSDIPPPPEQSAEICAVNAGRMAAAE
jgi:glyoxylase-like metal-dependent hydrolase (beta-lactamase superfamily II)